MKDFEVRIVSFDELPPEVNRDHLSDNGNGKKIANYIVVCHHGKLIGCFSDAMEPEDKVFYRDLSWIPEALEHAYSLGRNDGTLEMLVEEHRREEGK